MSWAPSSPFSSRDVVNTDGWHDWRPISVAASQSASEKCPSLSVSNMAPLYEKPTRCSDLASFAVRGLGLTMALEPGNPVGRATTTAAATDFKATAPERRASCAA